MYQAQPDALAPHAHLGGVQRRHVGPRSFHGRTGKLTRPPLQYSFVANQVQSDPGANAMFAGADKKPIGACIAPDSFLEY